MFENILIGQYADTGSVLHRVDARVKIIAVPIISILLFSVKKWISIIFMICCCLAAVRVSGVKITAILKSVKAVIFLAVFTLVINAFTVDGRFAFSYGGLNIGIKTAVRLILIAVYAAELMFTAKPAELTDAIEKLLKPLEKIKVPVADIAVMMGLALRFIPTLGEEAKQISDAQKSRCADFNKKGITGRARSVLPLVVPLVTSTFRHSEELADAMDSRCYGCRDENGRLMRTRMNDRKLTRTDLYAILILCLYIAVIIGVDLI